MERRLPLKLLLLFFCISSLSSLTNEAAGPVRIALWASLDAYPGTAHASDVSASVFAHPIRRIKEIAPFLIDGMIYGWEFSYTPSDRARGVNEYFDMESVQPLAQRASAISYTSPWIEENMLYCWANYTPNESEERYRKQFLSAGTPRIKGKGRGRLEDGFDGIEAAAREAVKNAVHEYTRSIIKNKPKEITGTILVVGSPRFYIEAGKYVADLDFFLDVSTITQYGF